MPKAKEFVFDAVKRAGRRENIMIFGVGNTCGVGNNESAARDAESRIRRHAAKAEKQKK